MRNRLITTFLENKKYIIATEEAIYENIKKLTRNNPTMSKLFEELKNNSELESNEGLSDELIDLE